MVGGKLRIALMLNPVAGIIENFRACLFGRAFDWTALAVSVFITMVLLVYSAYSFRRMERTFADIV
jgi:lipopolysaccharide transport system permease protein